MYLQTERLVLRDFTMDDLPALWGIFREGVSRRHGLGRDGAWKDIYWYGLLREEYGNGNYGTHP